MARLTRSSQRSTHGEGEDCCASSAWIDNTIQFESPVRVSRAPARGLFLLARCKVESHPICDECCLAGSSRSRASPFPKRTVNFFSPISSGPSCRERPRWAITPARRSGPGTRPPEVAQLAQVLRQRGLLLKRSPFRLDRAQLPLQLLDQCIASQNAIPGRRRPSLNSGVRRCQPIPGPPTHQHRYRFPAGLPGCA
jgi:hypothetical protein